MCKFWIVRGAISDRPVKTVSNYYATRGIAVNEKAEDIDRHGRRSFTFEEIQIIAGFKISTLLIDCEGCIDSLFNGVNKTLSQILVNVQTILLEADMPINAHDCKENCVNYTQWETSLNAIGFRTVEKYQDKEYLHIYHMAFQR